MKIEDQKEAPESGLPTAREHLRGTETILVAEDDQLVRSFMKLVLQEFGYTVLEAINGKEAVARFLMERERIDLILCDVIMPGISGVEVQKQIAKESPKTLILFVSGYPDYVVYKRNLLSPGCPILTKPFTPLVLLRKVRETLDRARKGK